MTIKSYYLKIFKFLAVKSHLFQLRKPNEGLSRFIYLLGYCVFQAFDAADDARTEPPDPDDE